MFKGRVYLLPRFQAGNPAKIGCFGCVLASYSRFSWAAERETLNEYIIFNRESIIYNNKARSDDLRASPSKKSELSCIFFQFRGHHIAAIKRLQWSPSITGDASGRNATGFQWRPPALAVFCVLNMMTAGKRCHSVSFQC